MIEDIQLIVPMSGIGRRFVEAGYKTPKPLIEVDEKPMIEHVVNLFPGLTDITFICNEIHLEETNMRDILCSISANCKIIKASNDDRRGPVWAVSKIYNLIDDNRPVIVSYCDYGTTWDFEEFISDIELRNLDGSIACYRGFHPHMLGKDNYAFCKEEHRYLLEIKEKEPFTNNRMNEYASNGTYFFRTGRLMKKHFNILIENNFTVNNEFYVSLVFNSIVKLGHKVGIFEIKKMLQWGTPYDIEVYKMWADYFNNKDKNKNIKISENKSEITLILPMAGKGERFSKEGFELPKPFLNVDGEPMVCKAVECLPSTSKKIFIALDEHNKNFNLIDILTSHFNNCKVITIKNVTEGQARTCEIGIENGKVGVDNAILISACDNGVVYDITEFQNLVEDDGVDIIVWTFRNNPTSRNNPNMYSWVEVDSRNFVTNVSCKKLIFDDTIDRHTIIGTMFFKKARYFLEGLNQNYARQIRTNGEFYVDDVINRCLENGLKVKVFEVKNYICWGTPDDYRTYLYWQEHFNEK